jgi:hypothetical protein
VIYKNIVGKKEENVKLFYECIQYRKHPERWFRCLLGKTCLFFIIAVPLFYLIFAIPSKKMF